MTDKIVVSGKDKATGQPKSVDLDVTAGSANVRTLGQPSTLETRTFTIGADTDCFTDPTAPLASELITGNSFTAGKKRCRLTYHADQGVPFASVVLATINAGDDATALSRLTYADVSAGSTGSIDTRQRMVSRQSPVIEWNLEGTDATIDRIDMGGILDSGTGAGVVYLLVEVW